jgi:hypothetical protein
MERTIHLVAFEGGRARVEASYRLARGASVESSEVGDDVVFIASRRSLYDAAHEIIVLHGLERSELDHAGSVEIPGPWGMLAASGQRLLFMMGGGAGVIIDATGTGEPVAQSVDLTSAGFGAVMSLAVDGDTAYVAHGATGFTAIDLTTAQPR